ncbi:MAG: hypothetical protein ACYC3S_16090 [Chloroflexota bacterium]
MLWNEPTDDRGRHWRAVVYAGISLLLAVCGYLVLGLDRAQTLGYGVLAYVLFNVLNYKAMFVSPATGKEEREASD